MSTGHIRPRGKKTWELKFDLGTDPLTGKRMTRFHSFKGSKREAETKLAQLIAGASDGDYVDPSKLTISDFFDRWERDWAADNLSPKTRERYSELISVHIKPNLGKLRLQKLGTPHLAELYAKLRREGKRAGAQPVGLSARTVGHVHRLLHRALGHAVNSWKLISKNPASSISPPKVVEPEMEILSEDQVKHVLEKLRGRSLYLIVALALATGMRRGELLALRWKNVEFERSTIKVEQSLEETKATGLRFKGPKTKHGRRQIAVSPSMVAALRSSRKGQQEQRLAAGLGREPDDALVFRRLDGSPMLPSSVTREWRRLVDSLRLPKVSFHALRHTHASQLIASGMDVLTISRRLGHASASITLNVYGHLFRSTDDQAAAVFEKAFGGSFRE